LWKRKEVAMRRISENSRLKSSFQEAYHARETGGAPAGWEREVMRRIRLSGSPPVAPFWSLLESTLWRLAPWNALLIVPLLLLILNMDIDPTYDYLSTMPTQTERIAMIDFMGLEETP
jgi:hypothetical protein